MSQVPHELQLALNSLSPQTAHLLEQTVLDAIRLANAAERAKSVVQVPSDQIYSDAKDHGAFLNSYAASDEGLYDDCERGRALDR